MSITEIARRCNAMKEIFFPQDRYTVTSKSTEKAIKEKPDAVIYWLKLFRADESLAEEADALIHEIEKLHK